MAHAAMIGVGAAYLATIIGNRGVNGSLFPQAHLRQLPTPCKPSRRCLAGSWSPVEVRLAPGFLGGGCRVAVGVCPLASYRPPNPPIRQNFPYTIATHARVMQDNALVWRFWRSAAVLPHAPYPVGFSRSPRKPRLSPTRASASSGRDLSLSLKAPSAMICSPAFCSQPT
jgi:hypothetical protein